jgi:foldase protein PrsA
MRLSPGRIKALCAFFVVAVMVAGCGSGVPGNSVADVAGNPITTQAFNHWLFVAAKSQAANNPGSPVIVPDPPQYNRCVAQVRHDLPSLASTPTKQIRADCKQLFGTYAAQVMQFLIEGYWYQLEANRDHIKVTDAQVQKAFQTAKTAQFPSKAQFDTFLSQTGQTLADILFRFRINQIAGKLITKETKKVTPSAIQQYYNTHRSQFGTPERRDMRIVLTKTLAQANTAKRAVVSGQSWNKVARRYSIDPTSKNTGGLLVGQTKGQTDPALDRAAFAAPINHLVGPVRGQFGYYIFEVTKITVPTQQTLAQATPLIRQTLTGQQNTTAQTALVKLLRSHWLGQTSCRAGYNATVFCRGYKAPKTPTTPGG